MNASDTPAVHKLLKKAYSKQNAPIVELIAATTNDPFKILVTTILSARTKDHCTAEVAIRLFKTVDTPADLKKLSLKRLEKLIYPIGFYRTKAKHLKELPKALKKFHDRVPDSIEEMCELPGVGRKTANLVMVAAFDKHAICVDVHVHRICNRLGLIQTKDPYETEMTLREILPKRYWKTWNTFLVSYGQTLCAPVSPKCGECSIYKYCDRVGVTTSRG